MVDAADLFPKMLSFIVLYTRILIQKIHCGSFFKFPVLDHPISGTIMLFKLRKHSMIHFFQSSENTVHFRAFVIYPLQGCNSIR